MNLQNVGIVFGSVLGILSVFGASGYQRQTPDRICPFVPVGANHFDLQKPWTLAPQVFLLPPLPVVPPSRSPQVLDQYAHRLTVQVWGREGFLGSGTLLGRSPAGTGWIVTNAHVLRWSTPPFQVHVSDRSVYGASWVKVAALGQADLALLEIPHFPEAFSVSPSMAPLPESVSVNTALFSAGWSVKDHSPSWQFAPGQLINRLDKPLRGGYQFAYSSAVEKGMSGGPVLNSRGQLVGLNGMVVPLWEMDNDYEDGTWPPSWMQAHIDRFSWGIPSDRLASVWQEVNFSQHDRFFCTP